MTEERWTEQTETLVAREICDCGCAEPAATRVLAALADAGLLVAPDGEAVEAAKCSCPDLEVTTVRDLSQGERAFIPGWAEGCAVHGFGGTQPSYRKVTP